MNIAPAKPGSKKLFANFSLLLLLMGWWGWLVWFTERSQVLTGLYSWVQVPALRDGFGISAGLITILSGWILLRAWKSTAGVGDKVAACCLLIGLGVILPALVATWVLLCRLSYPDGWERDLARAAILSIVPVLMLLTGMAVYWRHRLRPRLLTYWLASAFLAGWIGVPVLLGGRLRRGLFHLTHPRFENVVMLLISLVLVLAASWWMRNQKRKLGLFFLAGLTAGPPGGMILQTMTMVLQGKEYAQRLPRSVCSSQIKSFEPLKSSTVTYSPSVRTVRFDSGALMDLPLSTLAFQRLEKLKITDTVAPGSDGPGLKIASLSPALRMGWQGFWDGDTPRAWAVDLEMADNGGPRYQGKINVEGSWMGLRMRPVVSLPAEGTPQLTVPGGQWNFTRGEPKIFMKHGLTQWRINEVAWSPHGAWARDAWRPQAHPSLARPMWKVSFSPAAPFPYSIRVHSEYGEFNSCYRSSGMLCTMKWQLFEPSEYKQLSPEDKLRLRAERQAAWQHWMGTAKLTVHEAVEELEVPFSMALEVPEESEGARK